MRTLCRTHQLEIEGVLWFGTAAPNLGYLTGAFLRLFVAV